MDLLVLHRSKAKPSEVPAAVGIRIALDAVEGVVDEVGGEGVVSREAAELGVELVARDVVVPGGRHGLLEGLRVLLVLAARRHSLDAAQLRQSVDPVRPQRVDELLDGRLRGVSNWARGGNKGVDKAVWAVGGKAGAGVTKQNPSRTWEALPFLLLLELGAISTSMKTARESLDELLVVVRGRSN